MNRKAVIIRLKVLIKQSREALLLLEEELQSIINEEEKKS